MTWLSLRPFLPYLIAFTLGFGCAWKVQSIRIDGVKQEHVSYVQEQTRQQQEAINAANKQRDESAKSYESAKDQLKAQILAGDVYRRCVDAGKCGVRVIASCPASALQATKRPDEAVTDPVPLAAEPTETLVAECATTTLMLNSLQGDIEAQKGY